MNQGEEARETLEVERVLKALAVKQGLSRSAAALWKNPTRSRFW